MAPWHIRNNLFITRPLATNRLLHDYLPGVFLLIAHPVERQKCFSVIIE